MRIETNSSMNCFMECPEKYRLRYLDRLGTGSYKSALGFGTFVHAFAESLHANNTQIPKAALLRELGRHDDRYHEEIRNDFKLAEGIASEWQKFWAADNTTLSDNHLRYVFTEHEWKFKTELLEYAGKSDGVVEHAGGKLYLYELKTAALRDKDNYIHQLEIDSQISGNIIGLKQSGINVSGVIYDIIWKPAIIRKTNRKTMPDETVDEYNRRMLEEVQKEPGRFFERKLIVRNEQSLEEFSDQLRRRATVLDAVDTADLWYKNTGSCRKFNSLCEFHEFCIEGHKELRELYKQRDMKHPELTMEVQIESK